MTMTAMGSTTAAVGARVQLGRGVGKALLDLVLERGAALAEPGDAGFFQCFGVVEAAAVPE